MPDSTRALRTDRLHGAATALLAPLVLVVSVSASEAQQPLVEEIAIVAGRGADSDTGDGWFFIIEVSGENLTSASVEPPSGGTLVLEDDSGLGFSLEGEAGPFPSFTALQAAHPPGSYMFTVEGTHAVTLGWNPIAPVGSIGEPSLVIDSPADGAANVSPTPDVSYTLDCTNCDDLNLEMENLSGTRSFSFGQLDDPFFPNPIRFEDMFNQSGATELENGQAEVEMLAGLANFTDQSFDPPSNFGSFEYIEAAVVFSASVFTVPEPGGAAAALAAFATLALLRRR